MRGSERDREIGRRIRNLRREQKLTQANLCKRLRLYGLRWDHHTIVDVEKGRRPVLLDEAVAVAVVLNVRLSYLAGVTNGYQKVGA